MKEEWKDIEGYEGLYQVSNMGNVKSLERTVWVNRGYYRTVPEKIRKGSKNNDGYLHLQLCKDGKGKDCKIHRLVATAFCENPEGYTEVNHRDEDKENNRADNLEWCSRVYNINYGTGKEKRAEKLRGRKQSEEHIKKRAEKKSKPLYSINKESGLILWWTSAMEASRVLGIDPSSISKCCKGRLKSAGGYVWHYAD